MRLHRELLYKDGYTSVDVKYLKSYEPFDVVCEYADFCAHFEDIMRELSYVRFNKLVAHHTDRIELKHYTPAENLESVLSHGILLDVMSRDNDFGQNIHCFTSDCPDSVWRADTIPVYFHTNEWWQVIVNLDSNFGLRHCVVCSDVREVHTHPRTTQISSLDYMKYFGYATDEFKTLYPIAAIGEFVDMVTAHNDGRDATRDSLALTQLRILNAPTVYIESLDHVNALIEYKELSSLL